MTMTLGYSEKVMELGAKSKHLASQRDALHSEVESLKERLALVELENEVNSLQNEIDGLLKEKSELQEKLAAFDQIETVTAPAQAPSF